MENLQTIWNVLTTKNEFKKKTSITLIFYFILGLTIIFFQTYLLIIYTDIVPALILGIIILIVYFCFILYCLSKTNKLEIIVQNLEEEKLYNRTLSSLYDNIRGVKHDFNNIVQAIGGYISTNDIDGLKLYYNGLLEDCQKINNLSLLNPELINNPAIYSLLTFKYYKSDEIGIKGVTVELVEVLENGNQYIWQTVNTGDNGKYQFENIIPGNYIVRFSYGHNKDIVLTTSNGGYNAVSYNGQDFKSTVYSQDLKNNVELADYIETHYSIQEADKLAQSGLNLSDAKDLWETKQIKIGRTDNNYTKYENESYQGRQNVNSYSLEKVQNHIAEVLASPYLNPNEQLIEELIKNTNMVAESGIIVLEGEYNRTNTDGLNDNSNGSDIYLFENDKNGNYTINNVDLGLTERPKAQLELNSKVTNVKITLSNKEVLFDAQKTAQNLVWLSNKEYNLTDKMSNNKYKEYYDNSKTNNKYNRYAYKTEIDELITGLYQNGANGIVQATMDEELMHGATIDVIYELKVTNSGETDYTGKEFYYKARGANESNKVVTSANLVTDYVANNLQYKEVENKGWNLIKSEELINKGLVNNSLNDKVNKFNSILQTSELEKYLKPGEEITKTLSLSQTITAQNENDDLTYVNMAEIVQTSNNVGRRMAYSIVGNQDPTLDAPSEVDATKAEEVLILPPFGSEYIYYGLAIAVAAILGLGIFLIKKKVMR